MTMSTWRDGLTNVAADKHFGMRLRRDGGNVLAAQLGR